MSDPYSDPSADSDPSEPQPEETPQAGSFDSGDAADAVPVESILEPMPPADPVPPRPAPRTLVFEDLTLSEALLYVVWRPVTTARLLWRVLAYDPEARSARDEDESADEDGSQGGALVETADPRISDDDAAEDFAVEERVFASAEDEERLAEWGNTESVLPRSTGGWLGLTTDGSGVWVRIAVWTLAVIAALRGGAVLRAAALTEKYKLAYDPNGAGLWFVLAGALVLGFESWRGRDWWAGRFPRVAFNLHRRFYANDLPQMWLIGLTLPAMVLTVLAGLSGGIVLPAALLLLAGGLWITLVIGTAPVTEILPDDTPPESGAEHAAPIAGDFPYVVRSAVRGTVPGGGAPSLVRSAAGGGVWGWFYAHAYQIALVPIALLFSALAYSQNVLKDPFGQPRDVVLTGSGSIAWALSIVLWMAVLAVDVRRLPDRLRRWQRPRLHLRLTWVVLGVIGMTALGAYFRLHNLSASPPEMTSDHIEKLLDSLHVSQGYYAVFFPNNGGREGFQMYVVAFVAHTLGVGFNFTALKLATAFEGILTLPALWWMARQVIGTDDEESRQLGNWVGITLAGLVAVSSWHVMLSRLGLRIVLTPLATTLVIGLLARAIRRNRMVDYVWLGAMLGASVYFYQADRMLPILVTAGLGLAAVWHVRTLRAAVDLAGSAAGFAALVAFPLLVVLYLSSVFKQSGYSNTRDLGNQLNTYLPMIAMVWFSVVALAVRARRSDRLLQYGGGLLAVIVVALALYIPMYHYTKIAPAEFWNRTRGRMFGESAFVRTDSAGNLVSYEPSLWEQVKRIWEHRDVFVNNYEDALRMYNWEGDGAWINNAYAYPALDAVAGGLLILGLVVWVVLAARRRRPEDWLLPVGVLVMLLPTALTLAYTIENPSFTRASGTIPEVFMLAALPLAVLLRSASRVRWRIPLSASGRRLPLGRGVGLVVLAALLVYGMQSDWKNFFTDYRVNYVYSWKPYTLIAKPMKEFAQGEGSYGNAFMVAWPYWLDHRILGTMAGDIRWPNGLVTRDELLPMIERNKGTPYEYDPTRPLFVMYNAADTETAAYLTALFPGGETQFYQYSYEASPGFYLQGDFYIYIVWAGNIN